MKKTVSILAVCILLTQSTYAQIKVESNGNVGIGTSNPSTTANVVTIEGENIILRGKSNNDHSFIFENNSNQEIVDLSPAPHEAFDGNTNTWQFNLGGENSFDWIFSYNGWFGTLNTTELYNYSDKRLKKNIQQISFDKTLFSKLNPVSFDISDSLLMSEKQKKMGKKAISINEYGFIAQEIQELYPHLVTTDKKSGYLKIKPLELLPILVKALQSQQAQIDALYELVKPNSGPKKVGANPSATTSTTEVDAISYPVLEQNIPNPFNTATTIGFSLPTSTATASVYVYDMNGVQLKSYPIAQRGKGNITIQGSELNAGMYLYALIADGKVIDTKRMILTK